MQGRAESRASDDYCLLAEIFAVPVTEPPPAFCVVSV
jgi:hypothetical protein